MYRLNVKMFCAMFVFLSGVVYVVGQEGSKIYGAKCASCHGKDGKGNPSMAKMFKVDVSALNLVDKETLGKTDEELTATISKGKDKMPVFGGKLKGDELSSVVAYVRGLGSSAPAKGKVEGGAVDASKIYGAKCASCHGKDGKGNPSMAKMFKVDNAALDLTDDTSGKSAEDLRGVLSKGKGKMPAYENKMKADEIDALVGYVRSLGAVKKTETK